MTIDKEPFFFEPCTFSIETLQFETFSQYESLGTKIYFTHPYS